MDFIFVITDTIAETTTTIQEPEGWDGINFHLQRDPQWHGFFDFVDDTVASLKFIGDGRDILQSAYDADGVQAQCTLQVSIACQPGDAYTIIYTGSFDFTSYKFTTSDTCYIEISVETDTAMMLLRNRQDQPVDLDQLASFDQLAVAQSGGTWSNTNPWGLNGIPASFVTPNTIILNTVNQNLLVGQALTVVSGSTMGNNKTFQIVGLDFVQPDPVPVPFPLELTVTPNYGVSYPATNQIQFPLILPQLQIGCTFITTTNTETPGGGAGNNNDVILNGGVGATVIAIENTPTGTLVTLANLHTSKPGGSTVFVEQYCGTGGPPPFFYPTFGCTPTGTDPTSGTMTIEILSYVPQTIITVLDDFSGPAPVTTEASVGVPVAIDITTAYPTPNMVPYAALNKEIVLKSKTIQFTSRWQSAIDTVYNMRMAELGLCDCVGAISQTVITSMTPDWQDTNYEVVTTEIGTGNATTGGFSSANTPDPLIFVAPGSLACDGIATFSFNINGSIVAHINDATPCFDCKSGEEFFSPFLRLTIIADTGFNIANYTGQLNGPNRWIFDAPMDLINFNMHGSFTIPNFGDGFNLYAFFSLTATNAPDECCYPDLLLQKDSFFQLTYESTCQDTDVSSYFINETLSRCAEAYTNGDLRVYSEYFGRPDAQPYPTSVNGCGALECIMNGLKIRNAQVANTASRIKMTTSLADCFSSLDAIHNIGMGLETDINRAGYQRLRIEPIEYFYQTTVLFTCESIFKFTREIDTKLIASLFKCGYQKCETWNNNGLYDLFGQRVYRTFLNQLQNTIDKTSKFLASDYAIEFMRRMYGITTSDGRYDNDIFILCLQDSFSGLTLFGDSGITFVPSIDDAQFVVNAPLNEIQNGDTIIISGASRTGNNGTFTVDGIQVYTEMVPITIDTSSSITVQFEANFIEGQLNILFRGNIPWVFSPGCIINLTTVGQTGPNTGLVNGQYTVNEVYQETGVTVLGVSPKPGQNWFDATCNTNGGSVVIEFVTYIPQTLITIVGGLSFEYDIINIQDTTNALYTCEQGNIENPVNILNPETVLNYRITPARNALRQFKTLIQAYRDYVNGTLAFQSGTANFYALGELLNACKGLSAIIGGSGSLAGDSCALEGSLLGEGVTLARELFCDQSQANPLFLPELVKFEYPISYEQFLEIVANPYGMIGFQSGELGVEYGFMEEIAYKPITGMCEFTLRPQPVGIVGGDTDYLSQTTQLGGDGGTIIGT